MGAVMAVGGAAFAQPSGPAHPAPRTQGPRVWLDLDQAELEAAYDQTVWAANREQMVRRFATQSEAVRARLGAARSPGSIATRGASGAIPIDCTSAATRQGRIWPAWC